MFTRAQIIRIADAQSVSAQVVERDYALAHAVSAIANEDKQGTLVFKSGTSLRLIHFEDYRYSADLDFSLGMGTTDQAVRLIQRAFSNRTDGAIELALVFDQRQLRVEYQGPLGRKRDLKLDISADELVIDTEHAPLLPIWSDVPQASVHVYTLVEAASEKLRCGLQRLQCRDIYDLFKLLVLEKVDAPGARESFLKKGLHKGLDVDSFARHYQERSPRYEARVNDELGRYMNDVPPFEEVDRRVRQVLRSIGLL